MDIDTVLHPQETLLHECKALQSGSHVPGTLACTHTRLVFAQRRRYSDIHLDAIDVVEVERATILNKITLGGLLTTGVSTLLMSLAPTTALVLLLLGLGAIVGGTKYRPCSLAVKTSKETYAFTSYDADAIHAMAGHVSSMVQTQPSIEPTGLSSAHSPQTHR